MRSRKIEEQVNNNLKNQKFSLIKNRFFKNKINTNKTEFAFLKDAVQNHNGEIIEPANDDVKAMETIVNLYNKKLIGINFEKDKLFVSDLGKSVL